MNHNTLLEAISREISEKEGRLQAVLPSLLSGQGQSGAVECHDCIGSTNTRCLALGRQNAPAGTLVCAELQTAGRGRRGRVWQAPAGTNIAMSLLLRPRLPLPALSQLTLVTALAVRQAVEQCTSLQPLIKWPNDLLLGDKKLCGILVELFPDGRGGFFTVAGIGLNVFAWDRPQELRDTACSLEEALAAEAGQTLSALSGQEEAGKLLSRERLIAAITVQLGLLCADWEQAGDLSFMRESYEAALAWKDEPGQLLSADGGRRRGVLRGISDTGRLLFEEAGQISEIDGGELSLRRG